MTDIVDKPTRSRMMSGIKGIDTAPELVIRKALHKRGFRYKLHDKNLPGKPDLVLPKHHSVIQVQGCFWHGHKCHIFKWPSTRKEFWKGKILGNIERDKRNFTKLHQAGWKTLAIWECALKGKEKLPERELARTIESWLLYDPLNAEIVGRKK
jgi:DNA mismatch endonuclease (patch repair protein)